MAQCYLKNDHVDRAEVEELVVASTVALEVIDLCAGPVLAVVVGQQGVVVLIHSEVDDITSETSRKNSLNVFQLSLSFCSSRCIKGNGFVRNCNGL